MSINRRTIINVWFGTTVSAATMIASGLACARQHDQLPRHAKDAAANNAIIDQSGTNVADTLESLG